MCDLPPLDHSRAGAETQAMLYNGFDERVGLTMESVGEILNAVTYKFLD